MIGLASFVSTGYAADLIGSFVESVSEGNIPTPISQADVQFTFLSLPDENVVVDQCKARPAENLMKGSKIICKLSNQEGKFVAKGELTLPEDYIGGSGLFLSIPLTDLAFSRANDIQEIDDVKLIVQVPPLEPKMVLVEDKLLDIDFTLEVRLIDPDPNVTGDEHFVTFVTECKFRSDTSLRPGSHVICILTDRGGNEIATGLLTFPDGYTAGTVAFIPIPETEIPDVQNVHDVKIKVREPTGATRTPGFWGVHDIASKHILGVDSTADCISPTPTPTTSAFDCEIPAAQAFTIGGTTHGKRIDDLPTYFASLQCPGSSKSAGGCSDITKNSDGSGRTSFNRERMKLTFELVAAIMNCKAGTSPGSDPVTGFALLGTDCSGEAGPFAGSLGSSYAGFVLNGPNTPANRAATTRIHDVLDAFNNSGTSLSFELLLGPGVDCVVLPDGQIHEACGPADPDAAAKIANTIYNDANGETGIPLTPNGLTGRKGYDDTFWSGFTQPFDI